MTGILGVLGKGIPSAVQLYFPGSYWREVIAFISQRCCWRRFEILFWRKFSNPVYEAFKFNVRARRYFDAFLLKTRTNHRWKLTWCIDENACFMKRFLIMHLLASFNRFVCVVVSLQRRFNLPPGEMTIKYWTGGYNMMWFEGEVQHLNKIIQMARLQKCITLTDYEGWLFSRYIFA